MSRNTRDRDFVGVGAVRDDDEITQVHVTALLKAHGIGSGFAGATSFLSILVDSSNKEQARSLLEADARKIGYEIWFTSTGPANAGKSQHWYRRTLNLPASALDRKRHSLPDALRGVLNEPGFKSSLTNFPFVRSVRWLRREYLDYDGKRKIGYEAEVTLAEGESSGAPTHKITYQLLAGGKVHFRGTLQQ